MIGIPHTRQSMTYSFDKDYFGIPAAGLAPEQIPTDYALLNEIIHTARIECFIAECAWSDTKKIIPEYMAAHYEYLFCGADKITTLVGEARQRAARGSHECANFIDEVDRIVPKAHRFSDNDDAYAVHIHRHVYSSPLFKKYLPRPVNMGPPRRGPYVNAGDTHKVQEFISTVRQASVLKA